MPLYAYTPAAVDALFNAYAGVVFQDGKNYAAHHQRRVSAKHHLKPIQDEVLNLIALALNGGGALLVANATGSNIAAGVCVYINGHNGTNPTIAKAGTSVVGGMAEFVLAAAINNGATGLVYPFKVVTGLDTSGAGAAGDKVYLPAAAGGAYTYAPVATAADTDQEVGVVIVKHATTGQILFYPGAMRLRQIGTSQLKNLAVTQAKCATVWNQHRNAVINGQGRVKQRVANYTLALGVYGYATDRFAAMATGGTVTSGEAQQSSPGGSVAPCGRTGYAHAIISLTATGSGQCFFRTRVEAKDAVRFKNAAAHFSALVQHNVGSNIDFVVTVRKANAADDFSGVTQIGTGTTAVVTGTSTTLALAIADMGDCANGIEIEVRADVGAVTTKSVWVTDVQLEEGATASPFEYRSYADELALCQRYFQRAAASSADPLRTGYFASGANLRFPLHFPVIMRAAPTLLYSAFTTWDGTGAPASGNASAYSLRAAGWITQGAGAVSVALTAATDEKAILQFAESFSTWVGGLAGDVLELYTADEIGLQAEL